MCRPVARRSLTDHDPPPILFLAAGRGSAAEMATLGEGTKEMLRPGAAGSHQTLTAIALGSVIRCREPPLRRRARWTLEPGSGRVTSTHKDRAYRRLQSES